MVSAWRYKEQYWINKAKRTPSEVNTFQFDDTEAVGLPHFTNRTYKGLPAARADYVSFLIHDHARNKKMYVFSRKGLYPKGANRLATTLLACHRPKIGHIVRSTSCPEAGAYWGQLQRE